MYSCIDLANRPRAKMHRSLFQLCNFPAVLTSRVRLVSEASQGVCVRGMLSKIKKFPGLVSLQTVLESSNRDPVHGPVGDDDFELWDHSQMLRNQHRYKWNHGSGGVVCKPSCIPIMFILVLIILVVLLPLLDSQNDKLTGRINSTLIGWNCYDECK